MFNMDNQQGPTVQSRELCSELHGSLDGRGVWGKMDTCICMAEPFCCPPEAITILSSVQFSRSVVSNSVTPWAVAHQASLSITTSWSLLKLMSIESVMPSNHLSSDIPFSFCLQSFSASGSLPMSHFLFRKGKIS